MDQAKKTIAYKFVEKLTKGQYSSNPLISGVSKLTMESMKGLHDTFGSNDSSDDDIKEQLVSKERILKELMSGIKAGINKYKEKCEFSTDEKEYNIIVILLDSILRHTSPNDTNSNKDLLKYINEISKLACSITAKEKDYLIKRYTQLLETSKYEQTDFLKEIFNEIKNREKLSSSIDSISRSPTLYKNDNSINDPVSGGGSIKHKSKSPKRKNKSPKRKNKSPKSKSKKHKNDEPIKTTKYSDKDIFELAYNYGNPSDAFSDLGYILLEKFPNHKYSKIYNTWSNDNTKMSSDEAFEALDDLIKEKTGVTLSKIQKYNHYIWDNNLYDSKLDKGNKSGKNIAYNHFFPKKHSKSKSPKRKNKSIKRKSKSPKRKSKSPKRKNRSSTSTSSISPKRKSKSPKRKSKSPKRKSKSPKRKSKSPKRKSRSIKRKSKSPKRKSKSPKRKSRSIKHKSKSPKRKSKSPKRKSKSPKRKSKSSKRKSRSPKRKSKKETCKSKKIAKTLKEFKNKNLKRSYDNKIVTDRKQAIAIALSTANRKC